MEHFTGKKTVLAVDLAVVVDWTHVLMIRRAYEPELGKLVLPGGHVDADNPALGIPADPSIPYAAVREGGEEIHIEVKEGDLHLLTLLDQIGRDPRETIPGEDRRVSICYLHHVDSPDALKECFADSDALEMVLCEIDKLTEEEVGFDHWRAILKIKRLRKERLNLWMRVGDDEGRTHAHMCMKMLSHPDWKQGELKIFWNNQTEVALIESRKLAQAYQVSYCPCCGAELFPPRN